MEKKLLIIILSGAIIHGRVYSQCTYSSTVADVTLQCSGGGTVRTAVAFNPLLNLYYSACGNSTPNVVETFGIGGGAALSSASVSCNYRGLWWNPLTGMLEGNTLSSGGLFSCSLNTSGYAVSGVSLTGGATMPTANSMAAPDLVNNILYYRNGINIFRYNKGTNAFISSTPLSGLPVALSCIHNNDLFFTGLTGSELALYDWVNRAVYFVDANSAAYSGSCSLPASAPNPSTFQAGFANNRLFLYDNAVNKWYGYPILNPSHLLTTLSASASAYSVCPGGTVGLSASGATSYTWNTGSGASSLTVSPAANSVYTVTGSNSFGCMARNTVSVNLIYGAVVSAVPSPTAICIGSSATINAVGVNSFTWVNSGTTAASIVVSPTATTTYSVQGTNSFNCVSLANITLTVNTGQPTLSIVTSTPQTCFGNTISMTASGANYYAWSNNIFNGNSFIPSATSGYTVTGHNACGSATAVTTVSIYPLPTTVVITPPVACVGQTVSFTVNSNATSYNWSPYYSPNNVLVTTPGPGNSYTLWATDGICIASITLSVPVVPFPTLVTAATASAMCQGSAAVLSASGAATYTWNPGNLSGSTVTVSPSSTTLYTLSATSQQGCVVNKNLYLAILPAPVVTVSSSAGTMCRGETSTLVAGGTAQNYYWNTGNTGTLITVSPVLPGSYFVTGTDSLNGCPATALVNVNVITPSLSITGGGPVCRGTPVTLQASGSTSYSWSTGSQASFIPVTPSVTTVYTLSAFTTSDGVSCALSDSVKVTVNPNPVVSISASRTLACENEPVTFTAHGALSYLWNPAGTQTSIVLTSGVPTVFYVNVAGTDGNGCSNNANLSVQVVACDGLQDMLPGMELGVCPNPNNGNFSVRANTEMHVMVLNALGQQVFSANLEQGNGYRLEIVQLAPGAYFVSGQASGHRFTKTVLVQH